MKKYAARKQIEQGLIGVLLLVCLLAILLTFQDYGITIDEPPHAAYGEDIVRWYTTFFQHNDFLNAENNQNLDKYFSAIFTWAFWKIADSDHDPPINICPFCWGALFQGYPEGYMENSPQLPFNPFLFNDN